MARKSNAYPSATIKAAWVATQIAYIMGWVGLGVITILAIVMFSFDFNAISISLPIEVYFSETGAVEFSEAIGNHKTLIKGFQGVVVAGSDIDLQRYIMWMPLVLIGFYLMIVYNLRMCLKNIKDGHPFDFKNVGYFKNAGLLILIGGPIYGLLIYIYGFIGTYFIEIPGGEVSPIMNIHLEAILAGLLILAFAQIYKEAIKIKAEHDFTK